MVSGTVSEVRPRFCQTVWICDGESTDSEVRRCESYTEPPSTFSQTSRALSQELRLSSDSDATTAGTYKWVAGAYYFNERQAYSPSIASGPLHVIEVEPSIPDHSAAIAEPRVMGVIITAKGPDGSKGSTRRLVITPWFLAPGRLTDRVWASARDAGIPIAPPLGAHRLVAATVLERFDQAVASRMVA